MSDWQFRIKQTGFVVASGSAPDRDRMASLMGHYILMYAQEGPIEVETCVGKGAWKPLALASASGASAPSRYHFTDESPFTVSTDEGDVALGKGWLAITEEEYASLSPSLESPQP